MKKLKSIDYVMIVLLVALVSALIVLPGKGHGKHVPFDAPHQTIYDGLKDGRNQAETELVCMTCHGKSSSPLPTNHPPKEQCLICHLLA
ncbi:MAG TPA: cytochrome C [Geomonas sp.]|nr:cytochrome C [Geomonas sp.]